MSARIEAIRRRIGYVPDGTSDDLGCVLIVQPVFFEPDQWISQPADWRARTVSSKAYDLTSGEGAHLWSACQERVQLRPGAAAAAAAVGEPLPRYGEPYLVAPRLGQGTFRVAVTDAYERCCSITGEHSLPVLEAAHIRRYADEGPHEVRNGLLLRADLHRLFDHGYVTITPGHRLEVSSRLRADYDNGRSYYPLHGSAVRLPVDSVHHPASEHLAWHNERVYRD